MITPETPLYGWWGFNRTLFLWINGFHAQWWDAFMLAVTNVGNPATFPLWVAAALLLAHFRSALMPQLSVAVFAVGYAVTGVLVPWLKSAAAFPRPLAALGSHLVTVVGSESQSGSFPSGHAAFAVLLCVSFSPGMRRPFKWLLWTFAGLVALSRIVVGAHFPADVLAGGILGLAVAYVVRVVIVGIRG